MASARQVAANRRNASLPRGPLSDEASAAIRENAVKHGLTAKHVVMQHEDYADYQELRASITMEYQPRTPQEHRYADQIAQNYWRLLRCRRVETATFENRLATLKDRLEIDPKGPIDNDEGISICMSNEGRDFDMLRRYETTIERAWYRAISQLRAAQKERRQYEATQAEEDLCHPPLEETIANCTIKANGGTASDTFYPIHPIYPSQELFFSEPPNPRVSENGIRCVSQGEAIAESA